MSKQKTYINKRYWLNPKSVYNSGAISYSVKSYPEDEYDDSVESELSIWDCSRKITLDFSFYTLEGSKVVSKKIERLINSLEEIKLALGKAYNDKIEVLK